MIARVIAAAQKNRPAKRLLGARMKEGEKENRALPLNPEKRTLSCAIDAQEGERGGPSSTEENFYLY